mmetsp:Transcript_46520/g.106708  ORF Transcript_46520/g.106708 Transcript_46520/m.106708 type:complete len:320 (+) Transcript_46520:501-1460(+)
MNGRLVVNSGKARSEKYAAHAQGHIERRVYRRCCTVTAAAQAVDRLDCHSVVAPRWKGLHPHTRRGWRAGQFLQRALPRIDVAGPHAVHGDRRPIRQRSGPVHIKRCLRYVRHQHRRRQLWNRSESLECHRKTRNTRPVNIESPQQHCIVRARLQPRERALVNDRCAARYARRERQGDERAARVVPHLRDFKNIPEDVLTQWVVQHAPAQPEAPSRLLRYSHIAGGPWVQRCDTGYDQLLTPLAAPQRVHRSHFEAVRHPAFTVRYGVNRLIQRHDLYGAKMRIEDLIIEDRESALIRCRTTLYSDRRCPHAQCYRPWR